MPHCYLLTSLLVQAIDSGTFRRQRYVEYPTLVLIQSSSFICFVVGPVIITGCFSPAILCPLTLAKNSFEE